MRRVSSGDLLAILRHFDKASDEHYPRNIEQMRQTPLEPSGAIISFWFNRQKFFVLFDDDAQDDAEHILRQLKKQSGDAGELVVNSRSHFATYAFSYKGKDVYLFTVTPKHKRLDVVLAERNPEISRSTWQKHIKSGHVLVNGVVQSSVKYDVSESDDIKVQLPEAVDYSDQAFPIVYVDDNVIVINKPAGVLTHAKGAIHEEFTVADFFRRYTQVGLDTNRPGIVHRLDRDTSGILIGARTQEAANLLKQQFADRKAKKFYLAIAEKTPEAPSARIDLPIERNPSAPSTFRVDAKGKPAVTDYDVIKTNQSGQSLIELRPATGRTHQLRVHMAYLKTPILGDRIYGHPADRMYLHAAKLEITISEGQRRTFEAPLPLEFEKIINH